MAGAAAFWPSILLVWRWRNKTWSFCPNVWNFMLSSFKFICLNIVNLKLLKKNSKHRKTKFRSSTSLSSQFRLPFPRVNCIRFNNIWKAPHKSKASDTICMIYALKRQRYLRYYVACIIAHSAPKQSTQKQGKYHFVWRFRALYAIMHAI